MQFRSICIAVLYFVLVGIFLIENVFLYEMFLRAINIYNKRKSVSNVMFYFLLPFLKSYTFRDSIHNTKRGLICIIVCISFA